MTIESLKKVMAIGNVLAFLCSVVVICLMIGERSAPHPKTNLLVSKQDIDHVVADEHINQEILVSTPTVSENALCGQWEPDLGVESTDTLNQTRTCVIKGDYDNSSPGNIETKIKESRVIRNLFAFSHFTEPPYCTTNYLKSMSNNELIKKFGIDDQKINLPVTCKGAASIFYRYRVMPGDTNKMDTIESKNIEEIVLKNNITKNVSIPVLVEVKNFNLQYSEPVNTDIKSFSDAEIADLISSAEILELNSSSRIYVAKIPKAKMQFSASYHFRMVDGGSEKSETGFYIPEENLMPVTVSASEPIVVSSSKTITVIVGNDDQVTLIDDQSEILISTNIPTINQLQW